MNRSDIQVWLALFWIVVGIVWLGAELGHRVWWLCGVLVVVYLVGDQIRVRRTRLAHCPHGTAGAYVKQELCEQCMEEDRAKRMVKEEKLRAERQDAYRRYLRNIRLPSYLQEMDPAEFESLACDLHSLLGYDVEPTSYSGDSGADGFLRKDGELAILQAERVHGSVGEPILRDLFGTMHAFNAKYGVVVTTGKVSEQARNWAENQPIRIIELEELSSLIPSLNHRLWR